MPKNLRAWLALAAALALVACTQPPAPVTNPAPAVGAPVPIDQTNSARSDQWTVVQPRVSDPPIAAIASRERGAYFTLGCRGNDSTSATVALVSAADPTDWPEARHLELDFDGGSPVVYPWLPTRFTRSLWGFYTDARATDFQTSLAALRSHHDVEAVAVEQGKEVFRQHFTLQGAAEAIDTVLKQCPLSTDQAPVAGEAHWGIVQRTTTGNTLVVGILRPGTDHGIEILCNENAKKVGIMIWPKQPFAAPADDLTLALGFDDGAAVRQYWNASAVVFDLWSSDAGFSSVIDRLRSHRRVTVKMGPQGQEQSEVFSLDGADAAIARVLAACGKSE